MANATKASGITVKLTQTKVTKNTVRFDAGDDAHVTNLYVNKAAWPDGEYPQNVTLTVA